MEEKFGFRTMAAPPCLAPPPLRQEEDKEKVWMGWSIVCNSIYFFSRGIIRISIIIILVSSILSFSSQGSLATRPGSFSFHIHKFLNIKQVSDHHGIDDGNEADKQKQNFDDHRMRTENIQTKI